jgi:hypothetical protein
LIKERSKFEIENQLEIEEHIFTLTKSSLLVLLVSSFKISSILLKVFFSERARGEGGCSAFKSF